MRIPLRLSGYFLALILFYSCARPIHKQGYVINDDMKPHVWADSSGGVEHWKKLDSIGRAEQLNGNFNTRFKAWIKADSVLGKQRINADFATRIEQVEKLTKIDPAVIAVSSGATSYWKKIKPGTIIHLDCYTATIPSGRSSLMPLHYTFDIPVRFIDTPYGKLKGYEKNFLLTYLSTNTRENLTSPPNDSSLVHLWNYLMGHMMLRQEIFPGCPRQHPTKIVVDYRAISELFEKDKAFYIQLSPLEKFVVRDLVVPRTVNPFGNGIKDFFNDHLVGTILSPEFYYYDTSDNFFSFVSYTAIIDGADYGRSQHTPELSTWSVYDWIHSGIPIYETKKDLRFIVFKKNNGRYPIVVGNANAGRHVRYQRYPGTLLQGSGKNKSISEEDLTNIFPTAVKRLVYK